MSKALEIANGAKNLLRSKFGLTTVEEEALFSKRNDICQVCERKTKWEGLEVCSLCGCVLAMKTKSIHSECPDGLW